MKLAASEEVCTAGTYRAVQTPVETHFGITRSMSFLTLWQRFVMSYRNHQGLTGEHSPEGQNRLRRDIETYQKQGVLPDYIKRDWEVLQGESRSSD